MSRAKEAGESKHKFAFLCFETKKKVFLLQNYHSKRDPQKIPFPCSYDVWTIYVTSILFFITQ